MPLFVVIYHRGCFPNGGNQRYRGGERVEYTISITNQCNLHCSYCYEKKMNTAFGAISEETMQRVAAFINQRGDADTVFLFGGEPLLYKDKVRFFCENLNARKLVITTNGTMLDEEFVMWCAKRQIIINMSHDGANCAERGVDPKLLDEKAKLLVKHQPNTLFQLVYTEETLPHLYDNILHLKELGAKKVSASLDADANPADIDRFGERMREQWQKIARIPNLLVYELAMKIERIKGKKSSLCEICTNKLFINWDGQFYPCVQFQNRAEFLCGSLSVGIQPEKARAAFPDYSMLSERCEGCEIAEYCRNACACRKMVTTGTVRNISEAACMEEQVQILCALEMVTHLNGGENI